MKSKKKNKKKIQESICKFKGALNAPKTRDVTCSKLQKYGENLGDNKLLWGHTLSHQNSDGVLNLPVYQL